jgi:RNA polymerase sigma factor (sigma-70 family)
MQGITQAMQQEQDRQIQAAYQKERRRLLDFIRKRVPVEADAEDILQDVFSELIMMYRLMKPVEQLASWLFTVARNRITDRYRKKKPDTSLDAPLRSGDADNEPMLLAELIPALQKDSSDMLMQDDIMEALSEALDALPEEQRDVFVAHELEGEGFKDISARTGIGVNTLLSRKRYAVVFIRERLRIMYDELITD